MRTSLRSVGAITLFVEDLSRSTRFYRDVFDTSPTYEDEASAVFTFENTIINLLLAPAARELIEPAMVGGRATGSRFQLTVWVEDTDAICAELDKVGVTLLNGPLDREWGMRTASFADPDGHIWEVAQPLRQAGNG